MKSLKINTEVFNSHRLPITELARLTGLSVNTVKSISQGKQRRIDFAVIEKLAESMHISPLDLLKETDNDSDK